jgi:hypothetical protein
MSGELVYLVVASGVGTITRRDGGVRREAGAALGGSGAARAREGR